MTEHKFKGVWITDAELAPLEPVNVFHRQLGAKKLAPSERKDLHILFRRRFALDTVPHDARLFITADDYYKLYINGVFVTQGPAPAYPQSWGYNTVEVAGYLRKGENVIAVHTLYQGLINRVWVSGDDRHGLLCDLVCGGETVLSSGESFLTRRHSGYIPTGTVGYETQFLETCDSRSPEVGFERPDFDDSGWTPASPRLYADYTLVPQATKALVFERITPASAELKGNVLRVDLGACYVGYLTVRAKGEPATEVVVRCAQELDEDGALRYKLRANCLYEERWILSGGEDALDWFDYKTFRWAELTLPAGCEVSEIFFTARHYPFELKRSLSPAFAGDAVLRAVWELCVRSQEYGVQEVIQDCMEREKGFYVGDGCYTALTHMLLSGDDSIVRKLIDDAFASTFITDGMVTCLDCSLMQEIAEYPLMLVSLILWHYRLTGDREYLRKNYAGAVKLLEVYRRDYERDGLLRGLDKWCVVEWPKNFRDGYDVDIEQGRVCEEPHVAINAYYLEAIRNVNLMSAELGLEPYRDASEPTRAFTEAFYDGEAHMFTDGLSTSHKSFIGNVFAFAFMLCPDAECEANILAMIKERKITSVSMFGAFPLMMGLVRRGEYGLLRESLSDEGAWRRILREGGTSTFEGWGKDTKWNTSLFHLTLSYGAVFLSDAPLERLFSID